MRVEDAAVAAKARAHAARRGGEGWEAAMEQAVDVCARAEVHGVARREVGAAAAGGVGRRAIGMAVAETAVAEAEDVIGVLVDAGRAGAVAERKREVVGQLVWGRLKGGEDVSKR